MYILKNINNQKWFGIKYYSIFKTYLDIIVGNELAMQNQKIYPYKCQKINHHITYAR